MRRCLQRIAWFFFLLLVVTLLILGLFRSRFVPVLCQLAQARVKTTTSSLIERAVSQQIASGNIQYDRIVFFEKDVSGKITALKTNMLEINRLKSTILEQINEQILALDASEIGVSMGSLLLPEVFAQKGPVIPVRVLAIRNSGARFDSHFSQAGINQTLHQLHMVIQVEGTVLVLGQTVSFSVSSDVMVAETVIVGDVPNSFS